MPGAMRSGPVLVRAGKQSTPEGPLAIYWQGTNGSTKTSQVSQFFGFETVANDGISVAEQTPHWIWNFDETGLYSMHYRIDFAAGSIDTPALSPGLAFADDLTLDGPHGSRSSAVAKNPDNRNFARLTASFLHRITAPTQVRLFVSIQNLVSGVEVWESVFKAVRIAR